MEMEPKTVTTSISDKRIEKMQEVKDQEKVLDNLMKSINKFDDHIQFLADQRSKLWQEWNRRMYAKR